MLACEFNKTVMKWDSSMGIIIGHSAPWEFITLQVSMMAVNSGSTRYKNIKDRRNLIAFQIYKAHGLLSDVQKYENNIL